MAASLTARKLPRQHVLWTGHIPQSKNRAKGIFQLGDHLHLFQHIKLYRFTKFHGSVADSEKFTSETSLESWAQVPQSKNSTKGIFQVGDDFYSF